jgi:BlaI family transcriptional regulator, penicillinase repressor
MSGEHNRYLSKRLQQIMELAYERGAITAADLEMSLPGSPANSTVRTQLRQLEEMGLLSHYEQDGKFFYNPTQPAPAAAKNAMQRFLKTYFQGSLEQALATLLTAREAEIDEDEFERLRRVIDEAADARKSS